MPLPRAARSRGQRLLLRAPDRGQHGEELGAAQLRLSRLLKKSFASTGKDGVVAVVEGQLNLDRAVVLEFG